MKEFSTLIVAKAPPQRLFTTIRDQLPALAATLDDIERVEELERVPEDGGVRVVSRWHARQTIPAVLRGKIGDGPIHWLDRARWNEEELICAWDIEPSLGDGAIACAGSTRFLPAMGGRGTRVQFNGRLDVAPAFIGAIAGPFQTPVRALVESIATSLIPANFRAVTEAAAKLA